MGMFDTLNQKGTPGNSIQSAVPIGGANGGSFAQKQMMQKNPIMRGHPAMAPGFGTPKPNPMQNAQGNPFGAAVGMKPNPMTGARPAMQPPVGNMGMLGGRKPVGGTMNSTIGGQLGGATNNFNPMQSPDLSSPQPIPPQGQMSGQIPNLSPLVPPGTMSDQLNPSTPPSYDMGAVSQPGLQNPPFGGEQPGSNSFQSMMESMGGQRPDIMPRGLSPSYGPMQQLQMQPIMMDENGLEPRRGPR